MRTTRKLLATSAACAALVIAMPAQWPSAEAPGAVATAAAQTRVDIGFFFGSLEPHGTWVRHARHNYVFVPAVEAGWRPYVHGRWVWTDRYGWYWVSDEPFAWATYHYGCWGYDPAYGWYWVPGTEWAPAWVTWRHGGGHVGWAPCAPPARGYVVEARENYQPPVVEAWVFVPERRFVAVDVVQYVVPVVEINIVLGNARDRYWLRRRDGLFVNTFLPRERAVTIVNQDITVYNVTEVKDPGQAKVQGNTVRAFRTEVAKTEPAERPKKVVEKPEELQKKSVLQETAKGEKPADAPPSAAELKPGVSETEQAEPAAKPEAPTQADKPETPDAPKQADKPEAPAKPDAATQADKPEAPSKPDAPKQADKPEPPAKPDRPAQAQPDGKGKPDGAAKERQGQTGPERGPGEKGAALQRRLPPGDGPAGGPPAETAPRGERQSAAPIPPAAPPAADPPVEAPGGQAGGPPPEARSKGPPEKEEGGNR